jgi:FKBP-type peptidyl-prolyl cis-trans isomerase 2
MVVKKTVKKKAVKRKVKKVSSKVVDSKVPEKTCCGGFCSATFCKSWKFYIPLLITIAVVVLLVLLLVVGVGATEVKEGDNVSVNYALYLDDGTLVDTNIIEVAEANDLTASGEAFEFTVKAGQVIDGFDEAVLGMHIGESKSVIIPAEKGYGEVNSEMVIVLPLVQEVDRFVEIDASEFEETFGLVAEIGVEFSVQGMPWDLKVSKIGETVVTVENLLIEGQALYVEGVQWPSYVKEVTFDKIVLRQDPTVGQSWLLSTGMQVRELKVSSVGAETFELDRNHPLAGKDLTFEISLIDIL